jgi:transposase
VDHGGTRHPPRVSKERVLETLHLQLCAPQIYPDHRYTNGMTEGFNNKIKLIQRRAFGLRNEHNRKRRILADCART